MTDAAAPSSWRFYKIGILVTGKGERKFLPALLRALTHAGTCTFEVVERIGQRSPITSSKQKLKMAGTGKVIPTKDEEEIGLPARRWLDDASKLLLLIDDLEHARREAKSGIFGRYRAALDTILRSEEQRARASVHFRVSADPAARRVQLHWISAVLLCLTAGSQCVTTPLLRLGALQFRLGAPLLRLGAPLLRLGAPLLRLGAPLLRLGAPQLRLTARLLRVGARLLRVGAPLL